MKAFISLAIFCLSVASVSAQFSRSLVIAFDVTVSMGNKLAEMKEATHFLVNRSQEVHTPNGIEFVLAKVPLHMTGPPQLTQKPAELRQWIKEMGLHLNPDDNECPERTMSALKDAISHARTHSLVYLFTDADPKDPELMNEVLSAAKSKNIEVSQQGFSDYVL